MEDDWLIKRREKLTLWEKCQRSHPGMCDKLEIPSTAAITTRNMAVSVAVVILHPMSRHLQIAKEQRIGALNIYFSVL
jgi:hypothetical protein